jgi:plasmid maintenance system antidote protein VapI
LLVQAGPVADDGLVPKPIGADVRRKAKTPNEVFGRAVTEMRTVRKLSQTALAASLGYSAYYFGRIERGRANITCDVMAAVGSYFGMSIGQFWTYAEKLAKSQVAKK